MSEEIVQLLQKAMPAHVLRHSVKWPSGIRFPSGLDDGNRRCRLSLSAEAVAGNMQTDEAAFEAWSLVLKAWLGDRLDLVELSWEAPARLQPASAGFGHYQRFLYRVIRFAESVEWFSVAAGSRPQLLESRLLHPDGRPKGENFRINSGDPKARSVTSESQWPTTEEFLRLDEHATERLFCEHPQSLLSCVAAAAGTTLERQLPVGIFHGEVTAKTALFSRGKSAIDLWAVSDGRALLFELKKPRGNKRVGALSELLFYAHLVRDLQQGVFSYKKKPTNMEIALQNRQRVEGFLLLGQGNMHPLLDNRNLYELLNHCFHHRGCRFGCIAYQPMGGSLSCSRTF